MTVSGQPGSPPETADRTIVVGGERLRYPDPATTAASAVMRGNKRSDTAPERLVHSQLHRQGVRFRKDVTLAVRGVRINTDIAFETRRIAIFVDGCFWHGCPEHGSRPQANSEYWAAKLARNVERDARNTGLLEQDGWTVLRYWEHDDPQAVVRSIMRHLGQGPHP